MASALDTIIGKIGAWGTQIFAALPPPVDLYYIHQLVSGRQVFYRGNTFVDEFDDEIEDVILFENEGRISLNETRVVYYVVRVFGVAGEKTKTASFISRKSGASLDFVDLVPLAGILTTTTAPMLWVGTLGDDVVRVDRAKIVKVANEEQISLTLGPSGLFHETKAEAMATLNKLPIGRLSAMNLFAVITSVLLNRDYSIEEAKKFVYDDVIDYLEKNGMRGVRRLFPVGARRPS
jgi:hypothetical protein